MAPNSFAEPIGTPMNSSHSSICLFSAWGIVNVCLPRFPIAEDFSDTCMPKGALSKLNFPFILRGTYIPPQAEKRHIEEWLEFIGVPMGSAKELGAINNYQYRMRANLLFYQMLAESLPKWPWPFKSRIRKGFYD